MLDISGQAPFNVSHQFRGEGLGICELPQSPTCCYLCFVQVGPIVVHRSKLMQTHREEERLDRLGVKKMGSDVSEPSKFFHGQTR